MDDWPWRSFSSSHYSYGEATSISILTSTHTWLRKHWPLYHRLWALTFKWGTIVNTSTLFFPQKSTSLYSSILNVDTNPDNPSHTYIPIYHCTTGYQDLCWIGNIWYSGVFVQRLSTVWNWSLFNCDNDSTSHDWDREAVYMKRWGASWTVYHHWGSSWLAVTTAEGDSTTDHQAEESTNHSWAQRHEQEFVGKSSGHGMIRLWSWVFFISLLSIA